MQLVCVMLRMDSGNDDDVNDGNGDDDDIDDDCGAHWGDERVDRLQAVSQCTA